MVLLDQGWPETVQVQLPIQRVLEISVNTLERVGETASAGVIKDAGDNANVTHGVEIFATVRRVAEPEPSHSWRDRGWHVTRRRLELPVGSAAINPVPLAMIRQAVMEGLPIAERGGWHALSLRRAWVVSWHALRAGRAIPGVEVNISVPNGEELARRTFNARIGIVGGISILGTTGIVRAMSTEAWRASVLQAIDVAAANGVQHVVLSTGGQTKKYARRLYPDLPEMAFVRDGPLHGRQHQACRRAWRVAGVAVRHDRQTVQDRRRQLADARGGQPGRLCFSQRRGQGLGRARRVGRVDSDGEHGSARAGV